MTSPNPRISRSLCSSLALVALLAAPVRADEPGGAYEAAFTAGTELFERGEFAAAREKFEAAYALQPKPLLLLNIGSTYRREGDAAKALEYYQRFLAEADADNEYRGKVREIIAELERELADAQPEPEPQDLDATPLPRPDPDPIVEPPVEPPADAPSSPGRGLRIAGLVTAGAGAVALGIGIQQGLHARSIDNELEGKTTGTEWTPDIQARYDEGQSAETRAIAFSVTGGVALAAGVTLYLLGRDRSAAEHGPSLTVAPYSDGATTGLAVGGAF